MNIRAIILTILIIAICIGFIYYNQSFWENERQLIDYVSDDAIAVVELNNTHQIESLELFKRINNDPNSFFLTSIKEAKIGNYFNSKNLLISIHSISNNDFGYSFYLDTEKLQLNSTLFSFLDSIKTAYKPSISRRVYNEKEIFEVEMENEQYSYLIEGSVIVFSKHSFLVEDAIRLLDSEGKSAFKAQNESIMNMPKITNDNGNLYVNLKYYNKLLNLFIKEKAKTTIVNSFAENGFFDITLSGNRINLNGFTLAKEGDFIKTFNTQNPVKDIFNKYIPNNTSSASKFLISNAQYWLQELRGYWSKTHSEYLVERNDFVNNYNFKIDEFFNDLDLGYCQLTFDDGTEPENILIVSTKDINESLNKLNELAESVAQLNNDSLYVEQYDQYFITELNLSEFPKFIFGPHINGFENNFYMAYNGILVFGNTVEALKKFIDSIEDENTWARSKAYNTFFNSGLAETNFSYSWNLQRVWPRIVDNLNSEWKNIAVENSSEWKGYKLGMAQFSRIDNSFYSNISISYEKLSPQIERKYYVPEAQLSFINSLVTKAYVVRNHNTNLFETIVQDSLFNLALIANNGEKLWGYHLDGSLTSNVAQVDFYNNNKLQYFFSTKNSIYVVDRLGNPIENYPIQLDFEIESASVVDYDKSKKYRFLLTDSKGNIFLTDKQGKLLEGWAPHQVNAILSTLPFHVRVRAKDAFVYLTRNGKLNIINRRGNSLANFPLELNAKFNSDIFIDKGSSFANTLLHLISESGQYMKVNMLGEIVSSEQLYKQTKEAAFKIVPDALGKSFVIARKEKNRLVILDDNKNEILSKDYPGASDLFIQYYYFNPENQLFAVTDPVQEFTYLYKLDGSLLNNQPINSDKEVGILYSESKNEYTVYKVHNDTFAILKF